MAERDEPAIGEEPRPGLAGTPARPSRPARREPSAPAPLREGERPAALAVATASAMLSRHPAAAVIVEETTSASEVTRIWKASNAWKDSTAQ